MLSSLFVLFFLQVRNLPLIAALSTECRNHGLEVQLSLQILYIDKKMFKNM